SVRSLGRAGGKLELQLLGTAVCEPAVAVAEDELNPITTRVGDVEPFVQIDSELRKDFSRRRGLVRSCWFEMGRSLGRQLFPVVVVSSRARLPGIGARELRLHANVERRALLGIVTHEFGRHGAVEAR